MLVLLVRGIHFENHCCLLNLRILSVLVYQGYYCQKLLTSFDHDQQVYSNLILYLCQDCSDFINFSIKVTQHLYFYKSFQVTLYTRGRKLLSIYRFQFLLWKIWSPEIIQHMLQKKEKKGRDIHIPPTIAIFLLSKYSVLMLLHYVNILVLVYI